VIDILNGGAGDDRLEGNGGDDVLDGGIGADIALGGLGNESMSLIAEVDTFDGGAGLDAVRFAFTTAPGTIEINADLSTGVMDARAAGNGALLTRVTVENVERIEVQGDSANPRGLGSSGADQIRGGAGADVIAAGSTAMTALPAATVRTGFNGRRRRRRQSQGATRG
jgi:serralysin